MIANGVPSEAVDQTVAKIFGEGIFAIWRCRGVGKTMEVGMAPNGVPSFGSGWIRFGYCEIDRGSGSGSSGATGWILFGFLRFCRFQLPFPIKNRWMMAAVWCIDDGCNGDES
ncbi:hypothetical protein F0562_007624 [Nyssa sinensis]|uniref:Uncharacterized protein n=1 Tax=Nyssa sinensis TaxID=561372 RepID=A0A5J5A672_9ASTE|nr:hypothetical protein F0562_007624 [Nyssa sinensis]